MPYPTPTPSPTSTLGHSHAWLHALLYEANFEGSESVTAAYQRFMSCRAEDTGMAEAIQRLQQVIYTKRACWQSIGAGLGRKLEPPSHLPELLKWELGALAQLTERDYAAAVTHAGQSLSVAALLRLNARQSVWYAGQAALLLP